MKAIRTLLSAMILLLPLSALSGWAAARFFAGLTDLPDLANQSAEALGVLYLRVLLSFSAGSFLLLFASLFVYVAVSTHVAAVAAGRKPEFAEVVRRFKPLSPAATEELARRVAPVKASLGLYFNRHRDGAWA